MQLCLRLEVLGVILFANLSGLFHQFLIRVSISDLGFVEQLWSGLSEERWWTYTTLHRMVIVMFKRILGIKHFLTTIITFLLLVLLKFVQFLTTVLVFSFQIFRLLAGG